MSIIELPERPRGPRLVRPEPADIIKHPNAKEPDPALSEFERIMQDLFAQDANMRADQDMASLFRDLEMLVLRISITAMAHSRQQQAVHMLHAALVNLKSQMRV